MDFLFFYADAFILVITVMATLFYSAKLSKSAVFPVRPVAIFFLLFGPMIIFFNMVGHNGEIGYRAIEKVVNGTFSYNFRFYSLIFMGVVFLLLSGYMIQEIKFWSLGKQEAKGNFIRAAVLMSLLSLPTVFFTPIGSLPTLASIISLTALMFAKKRGVVKKVISG